MEPTVFPAVHETLLDFPGAEIVQLHGDDRNDEEDIVVSGGDPEPVELVRDLAGAYEALELPDGVRLFAERGGSTNTELTARRNPQGITACTRGVPWARIEYARSVRESDDQVQAVQEATLSVLAAS
jgi:hypothetical protein